MFANILDSFTRACVPIFFMISGYLFFSSRSGPRSRHLVRLVSATLFYSSVGLLYRFSAGSDITWKSVVAIFYSPSFYHLWFFYALLPVYLLMMVVRLRGAEPWRLMPVLVLILVLNPSSTDILPFLGMNYSVSGPGFLDSNLLAYFLYALLGVLIGGLDEKHFSRISLAASLAIYSAASVLIATFTYLETSQAGAFIGKFYEYANAFVVVQAISLFVVFRHCSFHLAGLSLISALSLPVYGIHAFLLEKPGSLGLLAQGFPASAVILMSFVAAVSVSLALGLIIRRADRAGLVH